MVDENVEYERKRFKASLDSAAFWMWGGLVFGALAISSLDWFGSTQHAFNIVAFGAAFMLNSLKHAVRWGILKAKQNQLPPEW